MLNVKAFLELAQQRRKTAHVALKAARNKGADWGFNAFHVNMRIARRHVQAARNGR